MIESLNALLATILSYVWSTPLVVLLVGTGLLLTFALGCPQIKGFWHAIKVIMGRYDDPKALGETSHFQALCTALSATVGLGNIAGVAVAINLGGPGAVFWMMLTGLVGMSTKFTECSLAVMYRDIDKNGTVYGGPMYYITKGLGEKWKPLAIFFAFACMCGAFGAGNMFQSNQVASIFFGPQNFNIPKEITGITLAILTAIVIIGGIQRIGSVTSKLVPFMGAIYAIGSIAVIVLNIEKVPSLLMEILSAAFTGSAAVGGATGVAVKTALIQGVRRGCFSNEAGLGSAPIAHSAVTTSEPIREGVVALLEPFIDTVVICTMTALVILISGVHYSGDLSGVELTAAAFDAAIPGFGSYFVPIAVLLFAYSTLLSWSYYGQQAFTFIFGKRGVLLYKVLFCLLIFVGAKWSLGPVLNFSDIMLGLMALPNLIAVLLLLPKVRAASKDYFSRMSQMNKNAERNET